jgi:hypothetical protein
MKKTLTFTLLLMLSGWSVAQIEIYNEDFESGAPIDYTIVDNDGLTPAAAVSEFTEAWIRLADPDNPSDTVMGSTSFFSPVGRADRWLITPAITLGAYGNILYWEAKSHDASFPDDYMIVISTTDNQITSFTDTIGFVIQENETWTTRESNLSELGFDNQTIFVGFVNRTDDGFKLYMDDIRVEIEDPVGIAELNSIVVSIYPNPASEVLRVKAKDLQMITIMSLDGKEITSSSLSELNVASLQSGQYFVRVNTAHGTIVKSFIKE